MLVMHPVVSQLNADVDSVSLKIYRCIGLAAKLQRLYWDWNQLTGGETEDHANFSDLPFWEEVEKTSVRSSERSLSVR